MGSMAETNDPRESKDWQFGQGTRTGFSEESEDEWVALEKETTLAKQYCKIICFSTDTAESEGMNVDHIWERGYCQPRMWAQYADNHRGVCLVFDRNELRACLEQSLLAGAPLFEGQVRYRNLSQAPSLANNPFILDYDLLKSIGSEQTILAHIKHYWRELFFEKAIDWSQEREFRWLLWDREHDQHLFPFGSALKGIVLGMSFPEEKLPELMPFENIDIGQLNWKNGTPEVIPRSPRILKKTRHS